MSEAPGADTLEPTPGQRLIEGAKEPSTAMPTFPKPRPHHSFSAFARASSRSLRSYLREAGAHFASLTKEPDNDPVGSDTCIDCMGDGRYPSGATCKSCRGSGHVIAGDGISPKVPR